MPEPVCDGACDPLPEPDRLRVSEGLSVPVPEGVGLPEDSCDEDALPVAVLLCEGDGDDEPVTVTVGLSEPLLVAARLLDLLWLGLDVPVELWLGLDVPVELWLGLDVPVEL